MADNTITTIKIKATADTKSAQDNIKSLAEKLERLKEVATGATKMDALSASLKSVVDSAKGMTDVAVANVKGLASGLKSLTKINNVKLYDIAQSLKMIGESSMAIGGVSLGTIGSAIKAQAESIKDFYKDFTADAKTGKGDVGAGDKADESAKKYARLKEAVKGAGKALKFLGVHLGKAYLSLGKTLGSIAVAPWKRLGSTVSNLTKRFFGFFSALKRIALYRAIRSALKEITQGFKEGMSNLYQYSLLMNGQFAQSMDSLATSALYLKNSLGAMTAPIVNALAPAVDYLTDRFVELLNVFNQLVATITGASTWTKALKYPKQYAEAMDGASGSAKELRATLLGFDEINRLDDNSRGSRGRADELLDYSKMFEEATVDSKVKGWVDRVKEAFKNADFTDIGASLGEKLKKGLDKIDWESIKARLRKNAESVATLINGFINVPDLGASIGYSLAQAINVAVDKMFTFFNTVDWSGIGRFLGQGFNKFIDTFDIGKLAQTMAMTINSAISTLGSFLGTVNWSGVGQFLADGINNFFRTVNANKVAEAINNGILGALKAVQKMLSETDFRELGKKIGTLITNIKWGEVLKETAKAILLALQGVFETLGGLIKSDPKILSYIGLGIAGAIAGAIAMASVKNAVVTALTTLLTNAGYQVAVNYGNGNTTPPANNGGGSGGGGIFGGILGGLAGLKVTKDFLEEASSLLETGHTTGYNEAMEQFENDHPLRVLDGTTPHTTSSGRKTFSGGGMSFKAGGGSVETGDLFVANEKEPELIAHIGNKTQVANQDQIVGAIQQATINGNAEGNALLRQAVSALQALLNKDTTVVAEITTDSITNGLARQNLRNGRTTVAVGG